MLSEKKKMHSKNVAKTRREQKRMWNRVFRRKSKNDFELIMKKQGSLFMEG